MLLCQKDMSEGKDKPCQLVVMGNFATMGGQSIRIKEHPQDPTIHRNVQNHIRRASEREALLRCQGAALYETPSCQAGQPDH